jgi:hypothetical protein
VSRAQQPSNGLSNLERVCAEAAEAHSGLAALPFTARALRERQRIKVLAIGATPLNERDQTFGQYGRVEKVLESSFKGLQVEIVDRGISGEIARNAAHRIKNEVALVAPDLVLWQVGVADALALTQSEPFKKTLSKTVSWLREHHVDVVIIGLRYQRSLIKNPGYQRIREAIKHVVREQAILHIGHYESIEAIDRVRRQQDDPISELDLTDAGSVCMADFLGRALAIGLFARPKGEGGRTDKFDSPAQPEAGRPTAPTEPLVGKPQRE